MGTKSWLSEYSVYLAWVIALVSLVVSLYFSEILNYPPCVLCWYQRIFMYPLVFIIGIGIARRDRAVSSYALPLSIIGIGIALYHNFLSWGVISESLAPCTSGVSCVNNVVLGYGFITIPLLSLVSFTLITLLMLIHRSAHTHD